MSKRCAKEKRVCQNSKRVFFESKLFVLLVESKFKYSILRDLFLILTHPLGDIRLQVGVIEEFLDKVPQRDWGANYKDDRGYLTEWHGKQCLSIDFYQIILYFFHYPSQKKDYNWRKNTST